MKILFIDFSTGLESVSDLSHRPRGGMINSLFKVTDYLATQGHEVTVASDIKQSGSTVQGVVWVDNDSIINKTEYDVLVCNRGVGDGYPMIRAKKRVLWTHDLPHTGFVPDPNVLKAFNTTVFMSSYGERVWRALFRGIGRGVIIPNGVDKMVFYPRPKDLRRVIYFCHPNRGLDRLGLIHDALSERTDGNIETWAYSNTSMYPIGGKMGDGMDEFKINNQQDHEYKEAFSDGFHLMKPLPTHEIANEVGRAGMFIMPTGYPEICSNSVLQSLASGTPVITTGNLGSTPEFVKHGKNGMLTEYLPCDFVIHRFEIIRNALRLLDDEKFHRKLIRNAKKTKVLTWNQVGKKWSKILSMKA